MQKLVKDVIKTGALFFAVGFLLAVAAVPVAGWLQPLIGAETATHVAGASALWSGAFFAGFGMIDTALRPVFNWAFGDSNTEVSDTSKGKESPTKQIHLTIVQAPAKEHEVKENKHRRALDAERVIQELMGRTL